MVKRKLKSKAAHKRIGTDSSFMLRCTSLILFILLPSLVFGKRAAPTKVEPVVFEGVHYVAPNDDGRRAYIEAWNVQAEQKLWELTVFTNRIDPKLEEDVQWVFIKEIRVRAGALIVTSERGRIYRIDLKKRSVKPVEGRSTPH